MSQQWPEDWIVRVVGPQGPEKQTEYYIVSTNSEEDAKQRTKNWLKSKGKQDWTMDKPVLPTHRF